MQTKSQEIFAMFYLNGYSVMLKEDMSEVGVTVEDVMTGCYGERSSAVATLE